MPYLTQFQVVRPKYEARQQVLLDWIVQAHLFSHENSRALALCSTGPADSSDEAFKEELLKNMGRIGLGEERIKTRGFHLKDCTHFNWDEMEIYNLHANKEGYLLDQRMAFFNQATEEIFEKFYASSELSPHLIHTTCTGYVAPSPAQRFVSQHKKGKEVTVTHAYHMGCYAAIPSLRMAMGHCQMHQEPTDIAHTEFSSLHMNPSVHTTEQLLVHSLFADGFIKYRLNPNPEGVCFKVLAVAEQMIENSLKVMTWTCHPWGFHMTLSREIPLLIRNALIGFRKKLLALAGKNEEVLNGIHYAIHPGGPKIIEQIATHFALAPSQFSHSKEVFERCGNMSSATLPHIWDKILQDPEIPEGALVLSLAFGPGLVICGALLEKKGA